MDKCFRRPCSCQNAQPTNMIMDFEKSGYQFKHFWRKVQAQSLQTDHNSNDDIPVMIRFYLLLPLFHRTGVLQNGSWATTYATRARSDSVFRTDRHWTYIGWNSSRTHLPIKMWNQHQEVTQGTIRTTNAVEAWMLSPK